MKRLLLLTSVLATPAMADGWYFGPYAGYSLLGTTNTLVQGGALVTGAPTTGTTKGGMAGLTFGYAKTVSSVYYGAAFDLGYDFGHQCLGVECAIERHPGAAFQQVGELGLLLPFLNNSIIALRGGLAERTNNVCAFSPTEWDGNTVLNGFRQCDNAFKVAPDLGAKFELGLTTKSTLAFVYDYAFFKYSTDSGSPMPQFSNVGSVKGDSVFKIQFKYYPY